MSTARPQPRSKHTEAELPKFDAVLSAACLTRQRFCGPNINLKDGGPGDEKLKEEFVTAETRHIMLKTLEALSERGKVGRGWVTALKGLKAVGSESRISGMFTAIMEEVGMADSESATVALMVNTEPTTRPYKTLIALKMAEEKGGKPEDYAQKATLAVQAVDAAIEAQLPAIARAR